MPPQEDKDALIATLLFLLTRYTLDQDPLVGKEILQHLEMLQAYPKTSQSSLINACEHLCEHWRGSLSIRDSRKVQCCSPKSIDKSIH